jgi:hypothetical protein
VLYYPQACTHCYTQFFDDWKRSSNALTRSSFITPVHACFMTSSLAKCAKMRPLLNFVCIGKKETSHRAFFNFLKFFVFYFIQKKFFSILFPRRLSSFLFIPKSFVKICRTVSQCFDNLMFFGVDQFSQFVTFFNLL